MTFSRGFTQELFDENYFIHHSVTDRVLAIGRPRQSVPFFLEPSFHAMIPNHLPEDKGLESADQYPRDNSFEYGPFMVNYIQRFVEYKGFFKQTANNDGY